MKNILTKIVFFIFAVLVTVQFFVVSSVIFDEEQILDEGSVFKFKTRPIDPYDIFRGKYVSLDFSDENVPYKGGIEALDNKIKEYLKDRLTDKGEFVDKNPRIYSLKIDDLKVFFNADENGFAVPTLVETEKNAHSYIFVSPRCYNVKEKTLDFEYPFRKFFTNEKDAPKLEEGYNDSRRDDEKRKNTYLTVSIRDGKYAVVELYIDGLPSAQFAKKFTEEEEAKKADPK